MTAATERGQRNTALRATVVAVHAALVGIGFFVIGLPAALVLMSHQDVGDALWDRATESPPWLAVGALAVAAFYAVPLFWPIHLVVGLAEGRTVGGIRHGQSDAIVAAGRVLLVQAVIFLAIAVALAVYLSGYPAFVVPLGVAAGHLVLRQWVLAAR